MYFLPTPVDHCYICLHYDPLNLASDPKI